MSVTINAKGTSVSSFTIGKDGLLIDQESIVPPAGNDLTVSLDPGNSLIIDSGASTQSVIAVPSGLDLVLQVADGNEVVIDAGTGDGVISVTDGQDLVLQVDSGNFIKLQATGSTSSIITCDNGQDLEIDPSLEGGGDLILVGSTWPSGFGTDGQALVTDGNGTLSWENVSGIDTNVLIQIGSTEHYHAAYLTLQQAIDLMTGVESQIVVTSTETLSHTHEVTVTYNINIRAFVVTNISNNEVDLHEPYVVIGGELSAAEESISDEGTVYPLWASGTGAHILKYNASLSYNSGTGQLNASSFNATSTKRVKKDIKHLSKSYVDSFSKLVPREYKRTDFEKYEFGFVAEEVVDIYPEIVGTDDKGIPNGIDYAKLSTILTAKVQEQEKTINELKEQVSQILEMLKGK